MNYSASRESKETGAVVVESPAVPDLLNNLHTLRSLALDVKKQADSMRLWNIAVHCANCADAATNAINHHNATHSDNGQANAGSSR